MKCPVCGAAELIPVTRDIPHIYKGEFTLIPDVSGDFCYACGEIVLTLEDGDRYGELIGAFHHEVNARIVDPRYITSVREKLGLTQRDSSAIFGGGFNAFSRYETGRTRPPLALVILLKLLERHPELLAEINVSQGLQ